MELENLLLLNPVSRFQRTQKLGLSATLGTSGRMSGGKSHALLPSINLIKASELVGSPKKIGAGRFGTCYSQFLSHFKVCVKVFNKHTDSHGLCNEANMLSKFTTKHFPYLFGVLMSTSSMAIVTSFHGIEDEPVTLHSVLTTESTALLKHTFDWKLIMRQIVDGMELLHRRHKILHNDLKNDNILLSHDGGHFPHAIIADFGKACDIQCGKMYHLTVKERDVYKTDHPQIAPDLRDGHCKQSEASDVYSLGRIMYRMYLAKKCQEWPSVKDTIKQCMAYSSAARPRTSSIRDMLG